MRLKEVQLIFYLPPKQILLAIYARFYSYLLQIVLNSNFHFAPSMHSKQLMMSFFVVMKGGHGWNTQKRGMLHIDLHAVSTERPIRILPSHQLSTYCDWQKALMSNKGFKKHESSSVSAIADSCRHPWLSVQLHIRRDFFKRTYRKRTTCLNTY